MSKVYLVGAGPGDPDLITVRGRALLRRADVVLYDHLASPSLLAHVPQHAERIYVGKKRTDHAYKQAEIIAMMVEHARAGHTVVRLKGGDPFIFGRGGEELEGLVAAGVEYEVVPGVTAPLGIAATTGVPLTHRSHTSAVTFVTGHEVETIDWSRTGGAETLVVFMGLMHLDDIVRRLMAAGRSPDTPAMAVRWGTRPDQKTIAGRMVDLPRLVAEARLQPPATVIIGEVVLLRERLDWFEKRPLFGKRVIVTRAANQAAEMCEALRELGADPVELPVIELAPLDDYSELDACIARLEVYDWVVFTSVNAVEYFFARGVDARQIRGRICAIGPATAAALKERCLHPDLIPDSAISEAVADAFAQLGVDGARILLPRAAAAREVIPAGLTALGATVDIADAYRNVIPKDAAARIAEYRRSGRNADWIAFTSGSTVKNWLALAGAESLEGVRIASIGPATSDVVRKHGLRVDAEASPYTMDGLVEAIRLAV